MAASYPDNVKTWIDKTDLVDDVFAGDINGAYHEIIAIEEDVIVHKANTSAHSATSAATASRIMVRDASGRAKVASPSASDDIARKDTVDTHGNLTTAHSATPVATASRIIVRDASGRAQVAAPSAAADIARKDTVDAVQTNLNTHMADLVTDADGAHGLKIESGTFTPYISGTTVSGANTYSSQKGTYYKIGKHVHVEIDVIMTAKDAAMAGSIGITSLPFVIVASNNGSVVLGICANITYPAGYTQINAIIPASDAKITLDALGSGKDRVYIFEDSITNTTRLLVSADYITN